MNITHTILEEPIEISIFKEDSEDIYRLSLKYNSAILKISDLSYAEILLLSGSIMKLATKLKEADEELEKVANS